MTYVDNIAQLEYNNPASNWWTCYRDMIFAPTDIILQGIGLPQPSAAGYSITINVLKPDGTYLEDATSCFNWFYGYASISSSTNNFYYFNLQCTTWSPAMIANGCFTLEIIVNITGTSNIVFHQFTQAYQLGNVCNPVSNITISVGGLPLTTTDCSVRTTVYCGFNYNKFVSYFECLDQFTGYYYGLPTTVYGGNADAFQFIKITWLEGRLIYVPRTIKRTISLNCRLQKTETITQYKFLCEKTLFPNYKAFEIEGMLLSDNIYLNDKVYGYAGDTPFTKADTCETEYLLTLNLQDCDTYQIFNCTPDCVSIAQVFVLMSASATGKYYSQSGDLIATNPDELEVYFKSLPEMSYVQDITFATAKLPYTAYKAYKLKSSSYIPNYIYSGIITPSNRVFAQPITESSIDLTNFGGKIITSKSCLIPVIGNIYSISVICDNPVIGTIWLTDPITYNLGFINTVNGWTVDNSVSNAQLTESNVTFDLSVTNPAYNYSEGYHTLVNEEVGIISNMGWPQALVTITPSTNSNLPLGTSVTIDSIGVIRYSGRTNTENASGASVQLFGLNYNILNAIT